MASKKLKIEEVYDFVQTVLKPGMVRFLLAVGKEERTYKELQKMKAKKNNRLVDFIGLTKKNKDENGMVTYKLTRKGLRVALAVKQLYETINDILPEDED